MRVFLDEVLASDLTDLAVPAGAVITPGEPFRHLDRGRLGLDSAESVLSDPVEQLLKRPFDERVQLAHVVEGRASDVGKSVQTKGRG